MGGRLWWVNAAVSVVNIQTSMSHWVSRKLMHLEHWSSQWAHQAANTHESCLILYETTVDPGKLVVTDTYLFPSTSSVCVFQIYFRCLCSERERARLQYYSSPHTLQNLTASRLFEVFHQPTRRHSVRPRTTSIRRSRRRATSLVSLLELLKHVWIRP